MKTFRYLVGTLLAWLGLAGLADGFIVWQFWFDQGVMLHWQSMKAWISVVLLGWLPFRVPEWTLDYCLVGSIVAGGVWRKKWVEPKGFSIEEVPLNARAGIWWYRRRQEAKGSLFGLALWPLLVPALLVGPFLRYPEINITEASFTLPDGAKPEPIVRTSAQVSKDRQEILLYTLARFIGFIPFLFVTSTLLYRFG